jgi:PAS domain-containing protein
MVLHHIYYPVRDKAGAIMGVAIFAQDITERKQAEEAIRESQERLSTILKTTTRGSGWLTTLPLLWMSMKPCAKF